MLEMESTFVAGEGWKWSNPRIIPFQELILNPFNSSLHYSVQCFEGMKAYKDGAGKIRLFRPMCNMKRFYSSSNRLALPGFDGEELIKCMEELIKVETRWLSLIHI